LKKFTLPNELTSYILEEKACKKSIGFVPTMGYLHDGHASLIKKSVLENDITVLSIFVNPIQFSPNEDLDKYPRDIDADLLLAERLGVDAVFIPEPSSMYPDGFDTHVYVGDITKRLCGKDRPTHFEGVTTVVLKLFNICMPDRAYFGQKDAQQYLVIKKMARELNLLTEIVRCPIVREKDNLAMSSRNVYLSNEEREAALLLSKSLFFAKNLIENGERDHEKVKKEIEKILSSSPLVDISYIELVDTENLLPKMPLSREILIAIAAKVGKTRLIDNIIINC